MAECTYKVNKGYVAEQEATLYYTIQQWNFISRVQKNALFDQGVAPPS